jgi:hypothetical protein
MAHRDRGEVCRNAAVVGGEPEHACPDSQENTDAYSGPMEDTAKPLKHGRLSGHLACLVDAVLNRVGAFRALGQ